MHRDRGWWTGLAPADCPGFGADGRLHSLPAPDLRGATRDRLLAYFDNGWTLTELLFSALADEEGFYALPAHRLRHPMIFYWAHPAAFYVNKLRLAGLLASGVDADFEHLFASGVDEMPGDDVDRPRTSWPSLSRVQDYRRTVYASVRALIERQPALDGAELAIDAPLWALLMAMEHERIHLDTSSALLRELPLQRVRQPPAWPDVCPRRGEPAANPLHRCTGGDVAIGRGRVATHFGWDNEFGQRRVRVAPFVVSETRISNRELDDFVAAGGYRERRYWSPLGWRWRERSAVSGPAFWRGDAGGRRLRTLFAEMPMPWNWPAEVSYHEAVAFCAWRSERDAAPVPYRPLAEAEHRWLAAHQAGADDVAPAGGDTLRAGGGPNLNLAWGSPSPVDDEPPSAVGVRQLRGSVWEWCDDDFHPLPGFAPHPLYADFSAPCFDGAHTMILGGSFIATGAEASDYARFHFRPHFYRHAGFRLAASCGAAGRAPAVRLGKYDTRAALDQYLLAHYGAASDRLPGAVCGLPETPFPVAVAELAARWAAQHRRALDLGCAVGRTTFELARHFAEVLGVDLSGQFIAAASALQRGEGVAHRLVTGAGCSVERQVVAPPGVAAERVRFEVGDALDLPPHLGELDAVVAANLLDRVARPTECLRRAAARVAPGGVLVVTVPYTWDEAFTPRQEWHVDYALLADRFTRVDEVDLPFVLREHGRKFELVIAHATVWRAAPA